MDDLTYGLKQLCRRNRDGSHASQADRMSGLMLMARQLREAGFRQLRPVPSHRIGVKFAPKIPANRGQIEGQNPS